MKKKPICVVFLLFRMAGESFLVHFRKNLVFHTTKVVRGKRWRILETPRKTTWYEDLAKPETGSSLVIYSYNKLTRLEPAIQAKNGT